MRLLALTTPAELPTDALLARLRYRRAQIKSAGEPSWQTSLEDSINWVYLRLNKHLLQQLGPIFELFAIRTLILNLRYLLVKEQPPPSLLNDTLLAKPLCRAIMAATDPETFLSRLEALVGSNYPFFEGLVTTYLRQGPGGVEQQLQSGILQHGASQTRSPLIKNSLQYLIDMRNCLLIRKAWRWRVNQIPSLTVGGKIGTDTLVRIWARHDLDRLLALAAKMIGHPFRGPGEQDFEQGFIEGFSKKMALEGRDPLGLGVVLEYLWQLQVAEHNQFLHDTLAPGREGLLQEVMLT